jgi:hypothetical protein
MHVTTVSDDDDDKHEIMLCYAKVTSFISCISAPCDIDMLMKYGVNFSNSKLS